MDKIFNRRFFSINTLVICSSLIFSTQALAQNNYSPLGSYSYTGFNGWSVRAGLKYEQFSNIGSTFAESVDNKIYNINPGYHWGYNFGLGYRIPTTNTQLNLDFNHLHTSDSRSAWATNLTLFPDVLNLGPVTWARSTLSFDYDSADLTAGQMINLTPNFNLNFYGGLNYTRLAKRMETHASGFGNTFVVQGGTTFNGVGPTFGLDGYCSPIPNYPNFSIYGGAQSTFLYGRMTGFANIHDNGIFISDDIPDDDVVVPGLGGKIGLDWNWRYTGATLDLKLGYEVKQYFNVTKDSNYTSPINASFQGWYLLFGAGF